MPATVQALVESRLLRIIPGVARTMARHPAVADALIIELSERADPTDPFLRNVRFDGIGC